MEARRAINILRKETPTKNLEDSIPTPYGRIIADAEKNVPVAAERCLADCRHTLWMCKHQMARSGRVLDVQVPNVRFAHLIAQCHNL